MCFLPSHLQAARRASGARAKQVTSEQLLKRLREFRVVRRHFNGLPALLHNLFGSDLDEYRVNQPTNPSAELRHVPLTDEQTCLYSTKFRREVRTPTRTKGDRLGDISLSAIVAKTNHLSGGSMSQDDEAQSS